MDLLSHYKKGKGRTSSWEGQETTVRGGEGRDTSPLLNMEEDPDSSLVFVEFLHWPYVPAIRPKEERLQKSESENSRNDHLRSEGRGQMPPV